MGSGILRKGGIWFKEEAGPSRPAPTGAPPPCCTPASADAFETSSGDTGLCGGGNGNTHWVRAEGHNDRDLFWRACGSADLQREPTNACY